MAVEDGDRKRAYLAAMSGQPTAAIAARLGVTEAEVDALLDAEAAAMASSPVRVPADRLRPIRRATGPVTFLSDPDWILVEEHIDPIAIEDRETFGDLVVSFSDEVAHFYEDLVARCVDIVRRFPGVERADRPDRELVTVWGPAVDRRGLDAELRAWFRATLDDEDGDAPR